MLSLKKVKETSKTSYYVPTEEEDFAAYLDAVLNYDKEEFMEMYKDFPYVQARYTLMQYVLENAGFDVERIKSEIE